MNLATFHDAPAAERLAELQRTADTLRFEGPDPYCSTLTDSTVRKLLDEAIRLRTEMDQAHDRSLGALDEAGKYARRILKHYFQMAIGGSWDTDYDSEIDGAIDDLIAAGRGSLP